MMEKIWRLFGKKEEALKGDRVEAVEIGENAEVSISMEISFVGGGKLNVVREMGCSRKFDEEDGEWYTGRISPAFWPWFDFGYTPKVKLSDPSPGDFGKLAQYWIDVFKSAESIRGSNMAYNSDKIISVRVKSIGEPQNIEEAIHYRKVE